jgi:hypothetical protein
VDALIEHGELYFPSPAEFNDPFEASPIFAKGRETVEKTRHAMIRELRRVARAHKLSNEQLEERERLIWSRDLGAHLEEMESRSSGTARHRGRRVCKGSRRFLQSPSWLLCRRPVNTLITRDPI